MRVISCYKLVPDEQDIRVNPDQTLSFDRAQWKIGLYDQNAIEAAMQVVEASEGSVSALSVGGKILENSKLKKAVLSRGPAEAFMVSDPSLEEADAYRTALALAAAIRKMGAFDLVVCGEGSADEYAGQVGPQLGQLLGLPTLNAVSRLTPDGGKIVAERELEDMVEICELELPAVVSVTSDSNVPRIPSMKEIMGAGKKPATQWSVADLAEADAGSSSADAVSTLAPDQVDRKRIILEGEEGVNEIYKQIRNQ